MSEDIIARLKSAECYDYGGSGVVVGWLKDDPTEEAAEEIERLRARVAVLETALRYYADEQFNGYNGSGDCARAALEAKP